MAGDGAGAAEESLPASWYHDDAVFQRERQEIFARHWALIGRAAQLAAPGDFVAGEVAGYPVFVIRGRDGGLKAFHNVCRHRAGPIVRQDGGRCDVLRCAYHGWIYDLEGRLRKAPGFSAAEDFDRGRFNLFPVRAETWNGLVFVCLDPRAPDLATWLGELVGLARGFPALTELAFCHADTIEGAANWKTYSDNSAEGYHLPHVHKALNGALDRDATHIAPYENGSFVGFKVGYKSGDPEQPAKGLWVYKFPCLLLHFSERSFNLERVIPLGARRIRLQRWFWFAEDEGSDDQARERAMADSMVVMREDLAICEAVQRNLEAGIYQSGRLSSAREPGTLFVQGLVRQALAPDR